MKRIFFIILTILLFTLLVACSDQRTDVEPLPTLFEQTQTPASTYAFEPTPTQVPTSYTTGLEYYGKYQPIIVSIENSPVARPQTGLQTADIVYEVPVEGSITRFVCIFSDNVPEKVIPVRSARVPFLFIVHEYNAPFMHFGGSGSSNKDGKEPFNVYSHCLRNIDYDVDGLSSKWDKYYYRTDDAKAPHNVVGNPAQVQEDLYDYEPAPPSWLFDKDVALTGELGIEVNIRFCSNVDNYVSYTYDEQQGKYLRFMSGKKFIAKETNAQASVTNVILQYSVYNVSGGIKLWAMVGNGPAEFYIGGKKIVGTWERTDDDANTIFYDGNGNPITLLPGNTWVHICPQ